MKSRSYVFGALVLSLLIACLPAVAAASGPQIALSRDQASKSVQVDRVGKDLGDIVVSNGDPTDGLDGNDVKPRPIEQDGEGMESAPPPLLRWLQYVIKALNLPPR